MPYAMEYLKKIVAFRVARFSLAGLTNTAVSFAVLNVAFYVLHQSKLASIVVASTCAIAVSFLLNRNFVFLDKSRPAKKLARFIVVSVIGVFLIQNIVYALGLALLHSHEAGVMNAVYSLSGVNLSSNFIDVNISNLIASLTVMFWNYNGYKLFVFDGKGSRNETIEDFGTETA
jgi:putative flippase GtrA